MKYLGFKTLVLGMLLAFVMVSCNETTTPSDTKPSAPTNIRATSKSDTEVILKWDLSTSESDSKFTGYTLEISPGSFQPVSIAKGVNTHTVPNLTEGTIYTFKLFSAAGTLESATAATISWSPATRFDLNINDNPIYVYETASNFGSGLDFFDPVGRGPKTLTVANGANWNLALDTRTSGQIIIASPTMVDYNYTGNPGIIELSDNYFEADALNDVFDSQALDAGNFAERSIDLNALNTTTGVVIIARVKEGNSSSYNYAKVLIKKTGGSWLQGSSPNRYIECVISYQKTPNVPYAL